MMNRAVRPARAPGSIAFAVLIMAAAALLLLRLPLLAGPALWIDEAFSLNHARFPLRHLWTQGWRLESSPPLYYTALWAWIRLVGDSEAVARGLSLLFMAVAAGFVFRAARALAGRQAGAAAAVILLLPTLGFEFSMEIRPYALQLAFIAIALSAFAHALVAYRSLRLTGTLAVLRAVAPIVLAAAGAFYTHTTSFAFLTALALAGLTYGLTTRAGRGYWRTWVLACAALLLLCVPQLIAAAGVMSTNRAGIAWIPSTLDPVILSSVLRQLVIGQIYWGIEVSGPLAAAAYAAVALAAWRMRRLAEVMAVGAVVALAGLVVQLLAGLVQPVMLPRTVMWLWAPLAILLGCGATALDWRRPWPWLGALGFVMMFAVTGYSYFGSRPEHRPWHAVIAELQRRIEPGDRILVFDKEVGCIVDHYAAGRLLTTPRARIERGSARRFWSGQRLDLGCNRLDSLPPTTLGRHFSGADWVLTGDTRQRADLAGLLGESPDTLLVTARIERDGRVHASRVVRRGGPTSDAGHSGTDIVAKRARDLATLHPQWASSSTTSLRSTGSAAVSW